MSYARFGWDNSDVYVIGTSPGFVCCGCRLQKSEWIDEPGSPFGGYFKPVGDVVQTDFESADGMIGHLQQHIAAGHTVPDSVIPRLRARDES